MQNIYLRRTYASWIVTTSHVSHYQSIILFNQIQEMAIINVRENRNGNPELTIQRHGQH